ncbi:hypothetical protein HPB50_002557 [Hyalomma asiaticum]|uniref:Uncharacterized protein n=1 Tax=Hyalomma asiaticum TaxID=266040 RepID=A0ACB7SJT9_HYAAI|nr:hypothetical protein HPB50_002557 [Hyalomma asiaticum]
MDCNNDGSECSAFEERRAAGDDPLRGGTRQEAPAGAKKAAPENDQAVGKKAATKEDHMKSGDEVDRASHKEAGKQAPSMSRYSGDESGATNPGGASAQDGQRLGQFGNLTPERRLQKL